MSSARSAIPAYRMQWVSRAGPSRCWTRVTPRSPRRACSRPARARRRTGSRRASSRPAPRRGAGCSNDLDAVGVGGHEDNRTTGVRMRLLIGAGEHEEEVRLDAAGRPPLVAVDDPLVAVFLGGRRQHFRVRPPPCIGSVIANPESISAAANGRSQRSFCASVAAISRGCACSPRRAPHRSAPSARAGSGPPLRTPAASRGTPESEPAVLLGDLRGVDPLVARGGVAQRLYVRRRDRSSAEPLPLDRKHRLVDELPDGLGDLRPATDIVVLHSNSCLAM